MAQPGRMAMCSLGRGRLGMMVGQVEGRRAAGKLGTWEGRRRMGGETASTGRRASGTITTYTTRESVLQVLHSPPYDILPRAGWAVVQHPDSSSSRLALQKSLPPTNSPFPSCTHILQWLHLHLAPIADQLDHHPDIAISNFNHLTLTLFTHSFNALTPRDFRLALRIEHALPKFNQPVQSQK